MSTQEVTALIWRLAVGLVAVVPILSVLGVWLIARFTNAFDAYAGERAKLQVQFDNVAQLVEQTQRLTEATETIKAQLSDEVWTKQQRWSKRLDTYVGVIEALQKYQEASISVQTWTLNRREHRGGKPEIVLHVTNQYTEAMTKYNAATNLWTHTCSLAQLTCPIEAVRILRAFVYPTFNEDNVSTVLPDARKLAAKVSAQFVAAARKDLGYEPLLLTAVLPVHLPTDTTIV